jgi:hypothetical protein
MLKFRKTFHSKELKSTQHHANWYLVTDLKTRQNMQQNSKGFLLLAYIATNLAFIVFLLSYFVVKLLVLYCFEQGAFLHCLDLHIHVKHMKLLHVLHQKKMYK